MLLNHRVLVPGIDWGDVKDVKVLCCYWTVRSTVESSQDGSR